MSASKSSSSAASRTRASSRIPTSLQAVFIASQRGKEVSRAPPESLACRVFFRNWLYKSNSKSQLQEHQKKQEQSSASPPSPDKKGQEHSKASKSTASSFKSSPTPRAPALSPQDYLDAMIRSRGYSIERYKTVSTSYHNKPTKLQQASYDIHLKDLVRKGLLDAFRDIMSSGISPNPANAYGESLLHMVCRRGDNEFLREMVANGCSLQVADDYGRTPLHDACWCARPSFEAVEMILDADRRLLHMMDCRGALPLTYVRKDQWGAWLAFLESKKDRYWPTRNINVIGEEQPPQLTQYAAHSRPLLNPPGALPPALASMVASSRIKPQEARFLMYENSVENTSGNTNTNASSSKMMKASSVHTNMTAPESEDYFDSSDDDSSEFDSDDSDFDLDDDDLNFDKEDLSFMLNAFSAKTSMKAT